MKKENYQKRHHPCQPGLRFSPDAWAKLLYLRDYGKTEIGAFGLSAAEDLLAVEDILLVKQRCSPITVAFDDQSVADFFDQMVDDGYHPERFARIWIHTHPGDCPLPSHTDETTFRRVFGQTDWSVMAIVARGDSAYARLSFHAGPGGAMTIPIDVDFARPFRCSDWMSWKGEYLENVIAATTNPIQPGGDRYREAWEHLSWNAEEIYADPHGGESF